MCTSFIVSFCCCGACARASTMGGLTFVDLTPCFVCVMCPLLVYVACGKYLEELDYIRPGHMSKFPALVALIRVCFGGDPDAVCRYLTSASTLGRSYVL